MALKTHEFPTFQMFHRMALMIFFRITQYIGDTHNARTLIPMNTRMRTLPL
jgi:hypothetical protein